MRILLVSPLGFPVNEKTRYSGIEVLVYNFAKELNKQHDVAVMGHAESVFPDGVTVYPSQPLPDEKFLFDELRMYRQYQSVVRKYDVVQDFSHQHLIARHMPNIPSLNLFWHAPALAQYPKAPYNIVALSQWAKLEFERVYRQKAKYQRSIALDTETYKPSVRHRGDRFLTIGRMSPEKGNLEAIMLCKKAGVPIDVAGGRGVERGSREPLTEYEQEIQEHIDGKMVCYLGEVTEEEKLRLLHDCKALIYATGHSEVTSHKIQEAMLCGAPVIVPNIGAVPEIVTHGVNGYLCRSPQEYLDAICNVDKLEPMKLINEVRDTWSIESIVSNYIPLYKSVVGGERWK